MQHHSKFFFSEIRQKIHLLSLKFAQAYIYLHLLAELMKDSTSEQQNMYSAVFTAVPSPPYVLSWKKVRPLNFCNFL